MCIREGREVGMMWARERGRNDVGEVIVIEGEREMRMIWRKR